MPRIGYLRVGWRFAFYSHVRHRLGFGHSASVRISSCASWADTTTIRPSHMPDITPSREPPQDLRMGRISGDIIGRVKGCRHWFGGLVASDRLQRGRRLPAFRHPAAVPIGPGRVVPAVEHERLGVAFDPASQRRRDTPIVPIPRLAVSIRRSSRPACSGVMKRPRGSPWPSSVRGMGGTIGCQFEESKNRSGACLTGTM